MLEQEYGLLRAVWRSRDVNIPRENVVTNVVVSDD